MGIYSPDFNGQPKGRVHTCINIKPDDPGYSRAVAKLGDEIEYFTEKLSQKDEERFAAFIALYEDVHLMQKLELYDNVSKAVTQSINEKKKAAKAKFKLL